MNIDNTEVGYIVQDRTFAYAGGIVVHYHYWTSFWTYDLKLKKIIYNYDGNTEVVKLEKGIDYTSIGKDNSDYHRTRLV